MTLRLLSNRAAISSRYGAVLTLLPSCYKDANIYILMDFDQESIPNEF